MSASQHISDHLTAVRKIAVETAARKVDACLPVYVSGERAGVFFGQALLEAVAAFEEALEAAGPSEVAKRIGAWQVRPAPRPALNPQAALAS